MTEIRVAANRANARASTGPKTDRGKARAAQNARKHGLAVAIAADQSLSRQASLLIVKLGRDSVTPEVRLLLARVVEAQLDLNRVRLAHYDLIARPYGDPTFEPQQSLMRRSWRLHVLLKNIKAITEEDMRKVNKPILEGGDKYGAILSEFAKRLASLERYERRALSRRKFAIRALDAAGFRWPKILDEGLLKLIGS